MDLIYFVRDIDEEAQLEVVLDRDEPSERDTIFGTHIGWWKGPSCYLMIRRNDGNKTYIAERIIRAIHIHGDTNGAR